MDKIIQGDDPGYPEIVFAASDSINSRRISKALKLGKLKVLAPRLYTSNLTDPPALIVKNNLYQVLGGLFPGAVLSHRTALEGGISKFEAIVLTGKYTKKIQLPGITVHLFKGEGPLNGDMPFMGQLFLSSRERALLENCQVTRQRNGFAKTLSRAFVEAYLDKLCAYYGVEELNKIRDNARSLSVPLKMEKEFLVLDKLIGGLLGTREADGLKTKQGVARALGTPYDISRVELFAKLAVQLNQEILPLRKSQDYATLPFENSENTVLGNLAFFEAYFSNYIEGTEFEIEEAADIVFHGKLIPSRKEDAHDILGTFRLVSSLNEMTQVPTSSEELIQLLQRRHAMVMAERKDKLPGLFKDKLNRAGNTTFVDPTLVKGTLEQAFTLYQNLRPGIARAIFIMFVIAEVHPFLDGNGRIARIMMNAELESNKETRIIIPTVFRDDYILVLRRLSREQDSEPLIKTLLRAQAFVHSLDFKDYQKCLMQLKKCNAFMEPTIGKLIF